jgi:predicted transcriptional regulator
MSKEALGFRIESEKRGALDALAKIMQRDRSTLINEAIDAYLSLHHWQVELVEARLTAANAGATGVAQADVFADLRQRLQGGLN